jgi:hypothetical protein
MRPKFENFGFLRDYQISIYKLQKNLKLVLEIFYIQRLNYNLGILFEFFM